MEAKKKRTYKLFVYGTLKKGFHNHDYYLGEGKSRFLGDAVTDSSFTLYIEALPFLVREASDGPVEGELYEIDEDTLYEIDGLEGHPRVYKREFVTVYDKDGNEVECFAYLYPNVFKGRRRAIKEYRYD